MRTLVEIVDDTICTALQGDLEWLRSYSCLGGCTDENFYSTAQNKLVTLVIHTDDRKEPYVVTRADVRGAITTLKAKYIHHYEDLAQDNHDIETADALLQIAVFGDIIYG